MITRTITPLPKNYSIWDDFKNKHMEVLALLEQYNQAIATGLYMEHNQRLDITIYYNLLMAQIINTLLFDDTLKIPKSILAMMELSSASIINSVSWIDCPEISYVKIDDVDDKITLRNILNKTCINEKLYEFLQEICAQDVANSFDLGKKIGKVIQSIASSIIMDLANEELTIAFIRSSRTEVQGISLAYEDVCWRYASQARMREFKHRNSEKPISKMNIFSETDEQPLNYQHDKNACMLALLHIGVEKTGSTGTGFYISSKYVLTCAHVVAGATEVCSNIIIGDAYPEIYDVNFGEVVYRNTKLDIALIETGSDAPAYLEIDNRRLLPEIGEEVVVFGYPLGYEMPKSNSFGPNISFFKGYVSSNQTENGNSVTFLDIDVKSGNSGSPVISTKTGKVIGIISGAKLGSRRNLVEKMPYMIPIQHFLELMKK